MTKEELMQLPVEELADKVLSLKQDLTASKNSSDHWYNKHCEIEEKFNRYKAAVKNVVLFID